MLLLHNIIGIISLYLERNFVLGFLSTMPFVES